MVDFSNQKPSNNLVDLTWLSNPNMRLRLQMLNNFLNANVINKRSLENTKYNSELGNLPPGKYFPERPTSNPYVPSMIMDFLTNPDMLKDQRLSWPRQNSDFFKMMQEAGSARQRKLTRGSSSEKE